MLWQSIYGDVSTLADPPPSSATHTLVSRTVTISASDSSEWERVLIPRESGSSVSVCVSEVCAPWETFGRHGIQTLKRRRGGAGIRSARLVLRKRDSPKHPPPDPPRLLSPSQLGKQHCPELRTLFTPPMMGSCRKSSNRGWGLK